ncbi:hypothetical protein ACJX0J_005365 [Zea mays]
MGKHSISLNYHRNLDMYGNNITLHIHLEKQKHFNYMKIVGAILHAFGQLFFFKILTTNIIELDLSHGMLFEGKGLLAAPHIKKVMHPLTEFMLLPHFCANKIHYFLYSAETIGYRILVKFTSQFTSIVFAGKILQNLGILILLHSFLSNDILGFLFHEETIVLGDWQFMWTQTYFMHE